MSRDVVDQWLLDLRYSVHHYDDFCAHLTLPIVASSDSDSDDTVTEKMILTSSDQIRRVSDIKYGDICRVSVVFTDQVESLRIFPAFVQNLDLNLGDDVVMWKNRIRYSYCGEEENFMESEELIKELKDQVDNNNSPTSSNNPPQFPPVVDPVDIRRHRAPPPRPKTYTNTVIPVTGKKVASIDIRGPFKLEIGNELCVKIKNGERLRLDDRSLYIVDSHGKSRMIQQDVALDPTRVTQRDKNVVEIRDNTRCNVFHFDSSREAEVFSRKITSVDSNKVTITQKLLRLLGKRSSRDLLELKGIIKNEPIFGNTLSDLCDSAQAHSVPEFVTKIVSLIELPHNITNEGLYRITPNLATVQKIRCEVDLGNLQILDKYRHEVDVLTGTLKLFFRELKEPLIPFEAYGQLHDIMERGDHLPDIVAGDSPSLVDQVIDSLPPANRNTLRFVVQHLLKVAQHSHVNKMDVHNIAVSWGPSLIALPDHDLVIHSTQFLHVTEYLLNHASRTRVGEEVVDVREDESKRVVQNEVIVRTLVDLVESSVRSEGIYRKSGSSTKIDRILRKIDRCVRDNDVCRVRDELQKYRGECVHELCCVLKKFLGGMEPPLFDMDAIFEKYSTVKCDYGNLSDFVQTSKSQSLILVVIPHLQNVLRNEKYNKMDILTITNIFTATLLKPGDLQDKLKVKTFNDFFTILLFSDPDLFFKESPGDVAKSSGGKTRKSRYDNVDSTLLEEDIKGEADFLEQEQTSLKTDDNSKQTKF